MRSARKRDMAFFLGRNKRCVPPCPGSQILHGSHRLRAVLRWWRAGGGQGPAKAHDDLLRRLYAEPGCSRCNRSR